MSDRSSSGQISRRNLYRRQDVPVRGRWWRHNNPLCLIWGSNQFSAKQNPSKFDDDNVEAVWPWGTCAKSAPIFSYALFVYGAFVFVDVYCIAKITIGDLVLESIVFGTFSFRKLMNKERTLSTRPEFLNTQQYWMMWKLLISKWH